MDTTNRSIEQLISDALDAYRVAERSHVELHHCLIGLLVHAGNNSMNVRPLGELMSGFAAINMNSLIFKGISLWLRRVARLTVETDAESGVTTVKTKRSVKYNPEWLQACKDMPWYVVVRDEIEKKKPELPLAAVSSAVAKGLAVALSDAFDAASYGPEEEAAFVESFVADAIAELRSAVLKGKDKRSDTKVLDWVAAYQRQEAEKAA